MALVGRIETRPTSTTSIAMYQALVVRCLLCGHKMEVVVPHSHHPHYHHPGDRVVPACKCYDDGSNGDTMLQPVRMIPND